MPELTHDDVDKILKIIDEMGDRDIHLEIGDLKLHVTRGDHSLAPAAASPARGPDKAAPPVQPAAEREARATSEIPAGHIAVRAPTVGTFYRAASPGAKPYAEVGDHVEPDDTVCVFEVMKLFSSLKAGASGTVAAILVANETLVEQDQPLVLIKPD